MPITAVVTYLVFLAIVAALVRPVGGYLARVFSGERTLLDPVLRPVERAIYRVCAVDAATGMKWRGYALAFVQFTAVCAVGLYLLLRAQSALPGATTGEPATDLTVDLAANTAISFATTTTWQGYAGESTMSVVSQSVGLTAVNVMAGAAGLAVGVAFIRGFARSGRHDLGNFWVDFTRSVLWVLLPGATVLALALVAAGVPATWTAHRDVVTLAGDVVRVTTGPVAPLEAVKNLGTNGGGYFNANGAHPLANPSALTNLLGMLAIAVLPAALTRTFGVMTGRPRLGWAIFATMTALFVAGLALGDLAERGTTPALGAADPALAMAGGNLEGKEVRFGVTGSILAAITTSNGATGSYAAMHDSFTALGGLVPWANMLLGEMIYGGLGTGIYSFVMVALLAAFFAGQMTGRSPAYAGKRLGPAELRPVALYSVLGAVAILVPVGLAAVTAGGLAGLTTNRGPHGLSEIGYAFTSAFANNGQNFAGLSANTPFYNGLLASSILAGRLGLAILALWVAGRFAAQPWREPSVGDLPAERPLFAGMVVGTALLVGALTFAPLLALAPLFEYLAG